MLGTKLIVNTVKNGGIGYHEPIVASVPTLMLSVSIRKAIFPLSFIFFSVLLITVFYTTEISLHMC